MAIRLGLVKPSRLSLAAFVALAVPAAVLSLRGDDSLPKSQPAVRYEPMAMRSPFTAPTIAAPTPTPAPAPVGPRWWDQLAVTSLMEAGGTYFAAVVDKSNGKHYLLESGKPDQDSQLLLTEVQWNERTDQSTVTVRKGTDIAPPLRFDTSAVPSTPAGPQQPFNPQRVPANFTVPPPPPNFNGMPPPPPPPATSVVRRAGPIASRPPGQSNSATANQPGSPNGPAVRRVRPLGGDNGNEE